MLASLVAALFGCRHGRTTFPLTRAAAARPEATGTFVTCIECGQEFLYDWTTMRIGKAVTRRDPAPGEHQVEACVRRGVVVRSS